MSIEDTYHSVEVKKKKLGIKGGKGKPSLLEAKIRQASELAKEFGAEVCVIQDTDTNLSFLETPIPPLIWYNEDDKTLICEDPALAKLIRLVTNGDSKKIQQMLEFRSTRGSILRDSSCWIRMKLLAHYVDKAMSSNIKDPGTRALELMNDFAPGKSTSAWGKRQDKLAAGKKPQKPPAFKPRSPARDLLRVVKTRKEVREPQKT